jgi:Transposase and inactivated derivatives
MPKTYVISAEDCIKIEEARRENKNKQVEKRLRAVQLRGEGKKNHEIGDILETSSDMVSLWVASYAKGGIEALMPKKRGGNRRNISFEEEAKMLAEFEERANAGQVVEVSEIKRRYQELVDHPIGNSQIYFVLARHNWRKVKPRSKHPKKASDEVIEASKKLTTESEN